MGYKKRDESLSKFIKEQITKNVIEDNVTIQNDKDKTIKREPVKIKRKFSNSLINDPLLNLNHNQNHEEKSEKIYDTYLNNKSDFKFINPKPYKLNDESESCTSTNID